MEPDPYLWTWLARHGGLLTLVPVWLAFAAAVARGRRWPAFGALVAAAATHAWALGTHLAPLLAGRPVPDDPWALQLADAVPFAVTAALAAFGSPPGAASGRADAWALTPGLLDGHGPAAWLFGVVLAGRGWLADGRPRRWLIGGLGLLALATAADAHRGELGSALQRHADLGVDTAARLASASAGAFELSGWTVVSACVAGPLVSPPVTTRPCAPRTTPPPG